MKKKFGFTDCGIADSTWGAKNGMKEPAL